MLSRLFDQIGARPLGLSRIVVGIAAFARSFVALPVLLSLTDPEMMRAPYVDWIPQPTVPVVGAVVAIWAISALLFAAGWKVAVSGPVLLASIVFTLALDQQSYSNHLYLMAWLVLLLTMAGAGSGLNIHRTDSAVIRWPVLLLMAQLSIVYGFSAITKINETFLSGRVLAGTLGEGLVAFPDVLRTPRFLSVLAAMVLIAELFIAMFIWRSRFRPAAFILGFGLHASITLLIAYPLELAIFSLEMLAIYPLFLTQDRLMLYWDDACGSCRDWVHRLKRLDLLDTVRPIGASASFDLPADDISRSMHLVHAGETTRGFRAMTLALEHLVPTLWVAPVLRIPGISHAGEIWYRWQARRRLCPAGDRVGPSHPQEDTKGALK